MSKNKQRIIVIVFSNMNIGGIERKIVDLCHYYSTHPHTQVVLLLKSKQGKFIQKIPANVQVLALAKDNKKINNILFPFWLIFQFRRISPSLILSFGNFSSICAIIGNLFSTKSKLIISEDSSIDLQIQSDSLPLLRKILIKLTYPLATNIIVLTNSAQQKITKYVESKKVTILNNWLPLNLTSNHKDIKRTNDVLFVGRLAPQKDPMTFLRICHQLFSKFPKLSVTMIGEGPLESEVTAYIHTHSLPITLLSADSDVGYYYQSSKLLLLTSKHEGFPLTILESFSLGCPVVSPSLPEIVPFYSKSPEVFLYDNDSHAIKTVSQILRNYPKIVPLTKQYSKYVVTSQERNFHNTIKYLESYL